MRLQQFLARAGISSRRKAEALIRMGRVSINGKIAEIGAVVKEEDTVLLDGERVRLPHKTLVIALNKPKGYTTTHQDEHAERLVYELVPEHPGLHSVGRLDKDTEGLLLLTNDGHLTQLLTHPRNQVHKLYRAWSKRGRLSQAECRKLTDGMMLGDGFAKAIEAIPIKDGVKLVMVEGRKREVRRMLGKIGHPVEKLLRLAVGPIGLGEMAVGHWRYLSPEEIQSLKSNAALPGLRKPKPKAEYKPGKPAAGKPRFKHTQEGSSREHTPKGQFTGGGKTRASDGPEYAKPHEFFARKPASTSSRTPSPGGGVKSGDERLRERKRKSTDRSGPNSKAHPGTRRTNPK